MTIQAPTQQLLPRSFGEPVSMLCSEIYAVAARIAEAIGDFFTWIAYYICCFGSLQERWVFRTVDAPYRPLITPGMDFLDRHRIIQTMVGVPVEERNDLVQHARQLITPEMDGLSRYDIIKIMADVPVEERNDFVQHVLQLISPEDPVLNRCAMIRCMADLPVEERNDLVQHARQLITPEMYGETGYIIIKTMENVPVEERNDFVQHARQLITPGMDFLEAGFPVEERNDFVRCYLRHILYLLIGVPANQRAALVRDRLGEVPADLLVKERNDFVQHALQLITPEMDPISRCHIISAMADLPVKEKNDFVQHALQLITPEMDGLTRDRIIETMVGVPVEERNDFVQHVLQLITPEMDPISRCHIISAMADVPVEERNDFVQHALQLIHPEEHFVGRYRMIEIAVHYPVEERNDFIQRHFGYQLFVLARLPANQRAAFVRIRLVGVDHALPMPAQGIDVHEGNRDERVKAALQLLYQRQGAISQNRIDQGVDGFVDYLYASTVSEAAKQQAIEALFMARREGESFGPLINEVDFSILGFMIAGRDLIGRLWIFASQLNAVEQENAKRGMITALKNSYCEDGSRICNQGKTQHLVLAVLQGRFEGVDIERVSEEPVSRAQAMQQFFSTPDHQRIANHAMLVAKAKEFCAKWHSQKIKQEFLEDIAIYAAEQEMV